jgi:hypothetical protein
MPTTQADVQRDIVRFAIGAAGITFLLPLLPLYGGEWIFLQGYRGGP